MYKGYIIHEDKVNLVEDYGRLTEVDNVDNLRDILKLENTLENYCEDYWDYVDLKRDLNNKKRNKKSMAIASFTIGALSPLMSYAIGNYIAYNDISAISLPFGCAVGTILSGYGILELATIPNKEKIKNLEVNIRNTRLVIESLEDVIKVEKEESKKISENYKVVDNLFEDPYDNLIEYFENNKDNLFEEYGRYKEIINSSNDRLYNKVLTRMVINSKTN